MLSDRTGVDRTGHMLSDREDVDKMGYYQNAKEQDTFSSNMNNFGSRDQRCGLLVRQVARQASSW